MRRDCGHKEQGPERVEDFQTNRCGILKSTGKQSSPVETVTGSKLKGGMQARQGPRDTLQFGNP